MNGIWDVKADAIKKGDNLRDVPFLIDKTLKDEKGFTHYIFSKANFNNPWYDIPEDDFKLFETFIDVDLLNSPEFKELRSLVKDLKIFGDPPFSIVNGKETKDVYTYKGLMEHTFSMGRKGVYIQRYKGLGEMNPKQLWETTMDPETRTVLQVKIEDAVEADEIFTILMGDHVEPRRQFIEENALDVKNLDI